MRVSFDRQAIQQSRSNIYRCAMVCVVAGLVTACGLQQPESPNWNVDLLVPIASRHIDGPYIAAHAGTEYLNWTNDSGLVWNIAAGLDTVRLGDKIRATPPPDNGLYRLGSIVVGRDSDFSCRIDLADVVPLAAGSVPEISTSVSAPFQQAASFDSLGGASGQLALTIENELGVTVDNVTVSLFAQGSEPFASFVVPGAVLPGDSRTVTYELSNLSFGDDWTTTLSFHTPGGTVLSTADKHISLRTTFPNGLNVNFARTIVGESLWSFVDSLSLSESHLLSAATIGTGQLTLAWTNSTPLPVTLYWESQDLIVNGSALSGQATLASGTATSLSIDLAGAQFVSAGEPSLARVQVDAQSAGSDGETVEISSSQSVGYLLSWSEVTFSAATGLIAETQFATGTHSASLTWDDGLDDAGLDQWDAYLLVSSSLPVAAQLSGELTTNTGLHLPVSGSLSPSLDGTSQTRLLLQNGNLPLMPLPSEVQFSGTVTIGGDNEVVSVNALDFVSASVEFTAPAHMYLDNVDLDIDPSFVKLSGEDFGDRTNRLMNAVVSINFANRFPMGGEFTLRLASDSAGVNSPDALVFGPSTLFPAVTDASGFATALTTTELSYTLDSAQLALFEREIIWVAESLTLLGPGQGQPARISPADALDWDANVRIEYRVDGDVKPWEN